MLSGTVCPGARTFLSCHLSVIAGAAVQPTDPIGMGWEELYVKTGGTPFCYVKTGLCVRRVFYVSRKSKALGQGRLRFANRRLLLHLRIARDQQLSRDLLGHGVGDAVDLRLAEVALEGGDGLGGGDIIAGGNVDA